jgi:serine/threonine-protein kinase
MLPQSPGRAIGRYVLFDEIASGGMASVHLGRLLGPVGFARTVAIKRLHSHLAKDPQFVSMFLDEARLAARIHHPNVVLTLDVVALEGEVFLVLEYVQGQALGKLTRAAAAQQQRIPLGISINILTGMLNGLHAAHEATGERGELLGIVHRDVSPQNVLVGVDGVARVLDFGVAKAANRMNESTGEGRLKGKLAYMAPEQVASGPIDRRTDVFAASILAWEVLTGRRLFAADEPGQIIQNVATKEVIPPSRLVPTLPRALDAIVLKGLERDPQRRYTTADEMATALESVTKVATTREVGAWVREWAAETLADRASRLAILESVTPSSSELSPSLDIRIPAAAAVPSVREQSASQPRSQLTEVSFAASAPPRRRTVTWIALGIVLASILGVGALFAARGLGSQSAAASPSAPPIETMMPVPVPTEKPVVADTPPAPSATPSAATEVAPPKPVATQRTTQKPSTTSSPSTAKSSCKVPASCKPAWTIDKSGAKRFKPECAQYLKCM